MAAIIVHGMHPSRRCPGSGNIVEKTMEKRIVCPACGREVTLIGKQRRVVAVHTLEPKPNHP